MLETGSVPQAQIVRTECLLLIFVRRLVFV